jgi:hypothetical protein
MKDFVRVGGRLRALPLAARVTYSVFLIFTLIALVFSAWLGADMLGPDLGGTAAYYAGGVAPPAPPIAASAPRLDSPPSAAGPVIELPSEALVPAERDPIPLRKLLEVTHFHLFSMPVYLMILAHLFMLSRLSPRTKLSWNALASLSVVLHIAAPWIARTGISGGPAFYAISGGLLMASFLVLAGVPLFEMWTSPPMLTDR